MVRDDLVRTQINKRASQIRSFVGWCIEELVSPVVLEGLRAVRPLAPGRSGAREGEPRTAADPAVVERVLPLLPPALRAVVALLRLTGARPAEIMAIRPCDRDRSPAAWVFTPYRRKNCWRGKGRTIYLGLKPSGNSCRGWTPSRARS